MLQSWLDVRVSSKTVEATDIVVLELVDPQGRELPPFSAGAHIDVEVPFGVVRQYSLCNSAAERNRYLIAILREPESRGGSEFLHDTLSEGEIIRISEPRNHFPLVTDARRCLLFAGGIGVTPVLCMAERLARTQRDFDMHYCVRTEDRAAFRDRVRDPLFAGRIRVHIDTGPEAQKLDLPGCLADRGPDDHLYVCGPAGFIDWVLASAREAGWPESALHREYFAAPDTLVDEGGDQFSVRIASTGQMVEIAAGQTVAQALADAGIELPMSCEQGTCGSCLSRVLEGTPDHRDFYLTDDERERNDQFLPCVSRARTALLVLDL